MVGSAKIELGRKLDHQRSFKTSRPSRLRVILGSEILAREAAKGAKGKREIGICKTLKIVEFKSHSEEMVGVTKRVHCTSHSTRYCVRIES